MSAKCQEATSIAPNSCLRNDVPVVRTGSVSNSANTPNTSNPVRTILRPAAAYQGRHSLYLRRFIHASTEGVEQTNLQLRGQRIAEYRDVWSYIGGTTPLPNSTAPLSSVPSVCFSAGTKTVSPGLMSLCSAGTSPTIGIFAGIVMLFSPPL